MNRLNNKSFIIYRPSDQADAYGEVGYESTGITIDMMIAESSVQADNDNPKSVQASYQGITAYKGLKPNYKLISGSDAYIITSANNSARFAQIELTKA